MNHTTPGCSNCKKSGCQLMLFSGSFLLCKECIERCLEILSPCESAQQTSTDQEVPLSPAKIKAVLDEHVVGQESAKRSLAVAAYNHCKIIRHNYRANQELQLEKTNSIVVGPTGCGKTLLIKVIGKILSVPTVIVDATTLTEAGYVGEDVESILHKLLKAADNDIQVAQKGIIYIDEIDKIAIKSETSRSITRDVSGEGVQQALLKLIEGSVVSVPLSGNKRHAQQESVMMDTTNIMFICGGAFPDVDKIIKTRVTGGGVGFGMTHNIGENKISRQDLVTFGMIPEFVGRFPSIVEMKALTETELRRILTEPKNSIVKQFQELLAMDGVQLEFTDQALDKIARIAIKSKSGARDLRAILYASLVDIMFDAPDTKPANVVITPDEVLEVA